MRSRATHASALLPEVRAALAGRTALEWETMFGERVPCAAVRPIEEMFDHSQVVAEELVTTLDHPVVGPYRTMTKPVKFADTPGPAPTAAPTFGQHSKEVLAGYWVIDVETPQRAYEIAARASVAPGRGGAPLYMPIEVRPVMMSSTTGEL